MRVKGRQEYNDLMTCLIEGQSRGLNTNEYCLHQREAYTERLVKELKSATPEEVEQLLTSAVNLGFDIKDIRIPRGKISAKVRKVLKVRRKLLNENKKLRDKLEAAFAHSSKAIHKARLFPRDQPGPLPKENRDTDEYGRRQGLIERFFQAQER